MSERSNEEGVLRLLQREALAGELCAVAAEHCGRCVECLIRKMKLRW